ncbi:uncharacterized protein DS421_8g244030 [Arachis hypogaea]|nr:uncharacterized protein DS421_8g244030 [Arachis hypogaea]
MHTNTLQSSQNRGTNSHHHNPYETMKLQPLQQKSSLFWKTFTVSHTPKKDRSSGTPKPQQEHVLGWLRGEKKE